MLARKIVGNTGVLILGKGAMLLVSMATFSLLTRSLGPELYGRYNLVLNVVGIAAILAELGLSTIVIRELAAGRAGVDKVLPAVIAIRVGLGAFGILASVAIGWAIGYDFGLIELIALYSLTLVIRGIVAGSYGLLSMAALQAWKNVLAEAADALLFLALVAVGIAAHFGLLWIMCSALAAAAVNSGLIFLQTRHHGARLLRVDWRYCWRLLKEALPLAVAGLFGVIYFRLDALMLSKLAGDSAVGIYGAAYKFIESASLISSILLSSLFPVFSFFFEHDRTKFARSYGHAIDVVLSFACSIAVFVYLSADVLVLSLNGAAFHETIGVLRICCGAIVLMFINNVGAHILFAARQQKHLVWINLAAAAGKVGVNVVVIPRYGPAGAALATVLTEILISVWLFVAVRNLQKLPPPIVPLAKCGAMALAAIVIFELGQPDLPGRALLLAAWGGAMLLIGMPKPRDVMMVLQRKHG